MRLTVVFYIDIKKEYGSFALASNFISKMTSGQEIFIGEVQGVSSHVYGPVDPADFKEVRHLTEWTARSHDTFLSIKNPDQLYANPDFDYIYCLHVSEDEIDDVVELQYYYLIKEYFIDVPILLILSGRQRFYHSVSHYFYSVTKSRNDFYNSVFYCKEEDGIIRLQLENIGNLKGFYPLQIVDNRRLGSLTQKVKEILSEAEFMKMVTPAYKEVQAKVSLEIRGCIAIWYSCRKLFTEMQMSDLYKQVDEATIMTFLLISYSLKYMRVSDIRDGGLWNSYFQQLREYAMGIQQLAENMVQHSTAHKGIVSIRLHKECNSYLVGRYGASQIKDVPYLEIAVTDYAANNERGNLADTFRDRLREQKIDFENVQPIDFFLGRYDQKDERRRKVLKSFDDYYSEEINQGKHFGLQIFMNIIQKNSGIFACYSHRNHISQEGEEFMLSSQQSKGEMELQMPGTGYMILLSLDGKSAAEVKRADTNIEVLADTDSHIGKYLEKYKCFDKNIEIKDSDLGSRESKENLILDLKEQLIEHADPENKEIYVYYINVRGIPGEYGEYICKALLMAELETDLADYVFYDCRESFAESFRSSMRVYYERNFGYSLQKNDYTIVLYTSERMLQTLICPGDHGKTLLLNKISSFARGNYQDLNWLTFNDDRGSTDLENIELVPYDILHPVLYEGRKTTIFERYTLHVLDTSIQESEFGCKITDTHMRLGSTIHIDSFYEAELLFSNKMFISRFAYLLIRQIKEEIHNFQKIRKITLYSYALYSELYIFEVLNVLKNMYPNMDIDYMILEREAEHRDYLHVDRIRYSHVFESEEKKDEYFKDRKIILVVPITSTLKTHTKLIQLLEKDIPSINRNQILRNYAIILVGSKEQNQYWEIDYDKRIIENRTEDDRQSFNVKYMVEVKVDYQEALGCNMCFPKDKLLNEKPLIEVNAVSTIPNQAFGLLKEPEQSDYDYEYLEKEEKRLSVLEKALIYSHTKRGENHFLFYFKTDELFLLQKKQIIDWLTALPIKVNPKEYHVLFSPSHFSNAGFLEYINKYVFHDAALIIRADIDKEYRSNLAAKYSNLSILLDYLEQDCSEKKVVRVYYVDDSIITGRTFYRAKNMISTVLGIYQNRYINVDIRLFDKIFVLLDRNSNQSKMQYLQGICNENALEDNYFAYIGLNISSLRNHGNSCVICQLKSDAEKLYHMSATRLMAEHWEKSREKFKVELLENKTSENRVEELQKYGRPRGTQPEHNSFRRLYCTHIAGTLIHEKYHGNHKENALELILDLLLTDYTGRVQNASREEAVEYFFSYLKVISRPFIVFNKSVKEAIFDILLILSELLLYPKVTVEEILKNADEKEYLKYQNEKFDNIRIEIINKMSTIKEKRDMLLLLVKQLIELKSNYFIRIPTILKIAEYIQEYPDEMKEDFYERYLRSIKKLLEINSDTSKSAWFNSEITDFVNSGRKPEWLFPERIFNRLVIENTRSYYNGIERLSKTIVFTEKEKEYLLKKHPEPSDKLNAAMDNDGIGWGTPSINGEEIIQGIQLRIVETITDISYRDFKRTLTDDGILQSDNGLEIIDQSWLEAIASNIELMRMIDTGTNQGDVDAVLDMCEKVAVLFKHILRAEKVQIMIEIPMECDLWEKRLRDKYNALANEYGEKEDLLVDETRNDYLIVAESAGLKREGSYVNVEVIDRFRMYRKENMRHGFLIQKDERYLIWEIGEKSEHQVLIYAEFEKMEDLLFLKAIRNLMMNYSMLNGNIFSKKNRVHLHQLLIAGKDALVYNQEKAHSHTKTGTRKSQYNDLRGKAKEAWIYSSHVMTLLADLKVSDTYRQSLKDSYYDRVANMMKVVKCSEVLGIYGKEDSFYAIEEGGGSRVSITVITDNSVQKIFSDDIELNEDDEIICSSVSSGTSDLQLLIHALILNAAMPERGVGESESKSNNDMDIRKVYLSKTANGDLRILNQTNEVDIDIDKINKALKYPLRDEAQGISLWSISRYLRVLKNICMEKYLHEAEYVLCLSKETETNLCIFRNKMRVYLEENPIEVKCGVKVITDGQEKKKYFFTEVPIFKNRYDEFFDLIR